MGKVRTSSRHLLAEKRVIHGTWYTYYFFKNKTFLFVKIEIWNFHHLFDLLFHETSQNSSSFGQLLFPVEKCHLNVFVWMSWNFCKVSQNSKSNRCWKFQLSILINNKVVFLKKYEVYHVPWIVLSSANRCRIVSQLSYMALILLSSFPHLLQLFLIFIS